jgi:hypothetical protein
MLSLSQPTSIISRISVEQRTAECPLITPLCRKDIYKILHKQPRKSLFRNVQQNMIDKPTVASSQSFRSAPTTQPFCNQSFAPSSVKNEPKKTYLRWLFKMNSSSNGQTVLDGCEFILTPEKIDPSMYEVTIQALSAMGTVSEGGIAVIEAFERLLSTEYIPWWTQEDVESLSIPFIAAFSRLLGGLDLFHAIKTRNISQKDINLLMSIPHIKEAILPTLELYHDSN